MDPNLNEVGEDYQVEKTGLIRYSDAVSEKTEKIISKRCQKSSRINVPQYPRFHSDLNQFSELTRIRFRRCYKFLQLELHIIGSTVNWKF